MRRTASQALRQLEARVRKLESKSLKISPNILNQIDSYIDSVWGMDPEWCFKKVLEQRQGADRLYMLIEIGCEDAGVETEYAIISQSNNRQVLEKMEILSLSEAQRDLKRLR